MVAFVIFAAVSPRFLYPFETPNLVKPPEEKCYHFKKIHKYTFILLIFFQNFENITRRFKFCVNLDECIFFLNCVFFTHLQFFCAHFFFKLRFFYTLDIFFCAYFFCARFFYTLYFFAHLQFFCAFAFFLHSVFIFHFRAKKNILR